MPHSLENQEDFSPNPGPSFSISEKYKITEDQKNILNQMTSSARNIFLTGPAGVGKSFVLRRYIESRKNPPPILASTGAAAVQIGGRTFHSFFGLGIMEGGFSRTVERACQSDRLVRRLKKIPELIIDEISMIHPEAFKAADAICKKILKSDEPFGGIRLVMLGDFFQLPPVDRFEKNNPWLFTSSLWLELNVLILSLKVSLRTESQLFVDILNKIRFGIIDEDVEFFLNKRTQIRPQNFSGTLLFGRRQEADTVNQNKLESLRNKMWEFPTDIYISPQCSTAREVLLKQSPITEVLKLKVGALVMIRKNDIYEEYVNGSLAILKDIHADEVTLQLMSGATVTLTKEEFHVLDGDGRVIATMSNFPLSLGWATTIHKSQGASIDSLCVNLKSLWEYGQVYVALSRAKDPEKLFIESWSRSSIKAHPEVIRFYENYKEGSL